MVTYGYVFNQLTGQVQSKKSMQEVIQFVYEKRLILLADEVRIKSLKKIPQKKKFFKFLILQDCAHETKQHEASDS